jgi:hypothetical protein
VAVSAIAVAVFVAGIAFAITTVCCMFIPVIEHLKLFALNLIVPGEVNVDLADFGIKLGKTSYVLFYFKCLFLQKVLQILLNFIPRSEMTY